MRRDRVSWKSGDAELDAESRRARRRLGCVNIGCLSLLVLAVVALWPGVFSHDWNCWRLSRRLARLPHPSGTHSVAASRDLGLLVGNGNHVDYFVAEVRTYSGSRDRIRRFYKGKNIWNPIAGEQSAVGLLFVDEPKLGSLKEFYAPEPAIDLAKYWKQQSKLRRHLYIIYVLDAGYDVGLDIRGC